MTRTLCTALATMLLMNSGMVASAADKPHIVLVAGDHEYRSEVTLPLVAEILRSQHGFRTSLVMPVDEEGNIDPKADRSLRGLEALADADLAVFYLRWRTLPDDQMQKIVDFVNSGRPMIGLRTTTHAFRNQEGEYARWNDGFGRDIFGQRWITHHGGQSNTEVLPAVTPHPVLRGVEPFVGRSWLYHVTPMHGEDVQTLLLGRAIDSNKPVDGPHPHIQPVAWTKTYTGDTGLTSRVFFTTLGHPEEFADVSMRRLVVNSVYWALGREAEIPEDGAKADLPGEFVPPSTH
ncbi:MAG: ThuA domain-containing protein [Thermoguttaceae bacterium]|jgi:type 1 glutamine amidotransferase|nr:ThuA domain-containing protein [Thermoguttaceae bacterium]